MIDKLFSSKVTFAVLAALFKADSKSLGTAELIKLTGKNQANIQRELDKLVDLGLVLKAKQANQNYYSLNRQNRYFASLKNVFNEYHNQPQRYFLFNEESGTCFLSVDYVLRAYAADYGVKKGIIQAPWYSVAVYKNDYGQFYFEREMIEQGADDALKKLLKDPAFVFKTIYPESLTSGEEAQQIFKELKAQSFKISVPRAIDLFDKFLEIISVQVSLNAIAVFDLKDQIFSNYLKKYLTTKVKSGDLSLSYALEKLLEPEKLTYTQLLRQELIKLAIKYYSSSNYKPAELKTLLADWGWLNYGYVGPGLTADYFQQVFNELRAKKITELRSELEALNNNSAIVRATRQTIYKKLKIDAQHQKFIEALSLLSYLKIHRKDTAFLIFYCLYQIFAKLKPEFKRRHLFNLTIEESKDLLRGQLKISTKELNARSDYCAYIYRENRFIYGSDVDKYLKLWTEKAETLPTENNLKLLDGMPACLGRTGDWVYGEVKIINSAADMAKMKEGNILVSIATTPDILPAMKKAAAIVTDHGGITCHAAIVSRELNIPCLIATKYATKVFKDGDKVIVCPRHNYIKFQ